MNKKHILDDEYGRKLIKDLISVCKSDYWKNRWQNLLDSFGQLNPRK